MEAVCAVSDKKCCDEDDQRKYARSTGEWVPEYFM
jgi:hypothetical protein